jgi:hypothetical protein
VALTIRIERSDGQWVAEIPRAKNLVVWSPSLKRLRSHIDRALREIYPQLASETRREVIELPEGTRTLLKGLTKAEEQATKAAKRAATLRRQASRRLRTKLGLSVREVGDLMGVSGTRVQQLLRK